MNHHKSKSSISIQSSTSSTTTPNELNPTKRLRMTKDLIELPKPFLELPISLSTLASSLHEIHTVARMTMCSSSTTSFLTSSKLGLNTEKLKKLAKCIERQAAESESGENGILKEERLIKKGRKWLRRKRKGFLGEIGGNETQKVDGVGLPLPNGATLVQPFDSDWS
ncbi:uncharacterized protein MELLADRAFT_71275 [Melampsora larici-populina 98AG31]|uniref:Uncharacterized protein n=1 Tax=Melampsora larici-populina (strain 98AG31 / pathotype 3-4-7) TaxID=747676 RepID=F4REC4_MELLP|nr:uncharacterized protein MELLADRAFT_71275 [Melampsora larici-populina 98AG31]EGG09065.1 hypothetical protein MELLADRAFT_71275 [Melampsora larici-populina 98AG31]